MEIEKARLSNGISDPELREAVIIFEPDPVLQEKEQKRRSRQSSPRVS